MAEKDRRVLTLLPTSATVIGSMIGTGVFTTTGLMVGMGAAGGDILLAWLVGGIVALCGALCYGEVGANLPESGGEYYYLSRLLHPALGFMSGCVSLVVGFAAPIAAAAIAMNLYLGRIISGWPVPVMAAGTILLLALLHAYDVQIGSKFQTAITVLKVILIVAFILGVFWGALNTSGGSFEFNSGFLTSSPFAVVLVFVSFAYSGWNAAAYIGTEVRNPERTLPWSLLLGTGIVTALYVLLNVSYLISGSLSELSGVEEVGHVVGTRLWGTTGGNIVSLLIALTLVCPISAMLMIGPRVAEAMAKDGFLPESLARLNARNVPALAVWLQALLAMLIAVTSSFGTLLIYIGFTLNIFAALTVVSLFRLRQQGRSKYRICVGYPFTPLVFLGFAVWMTVWSIQSQPMATLAGLGTLLLAFLAYVLRSRTKPDHPKFEAQESGPVMSVSEKSSHKK
jgi:APA family basic amino acid/polyamine antiporter